MTSTESKNLTIGDLLRDMVKARASDLHVTANAALGDRIDGEIVAQDKHGVLSKDDIPDFKTPRKPRPRFG
jgi:Tfp pilus assembly pilus retraction ATPase PilT